MAEYELEWKLQMMHAAFDVSEVGSTVVMEKFTVYADKLPSNLYLCNINNQKVMLQFITRYSERFSIAEEAQMAIEGGCRWLQLSSSGLADNEDNMRTVAVEIVELCKEKEAFLIIEDDINLVEELKVHGVFMHDSSRESVMAARERLGADAVIGVEVSTAAEALHLVGLDIDYLIIPCDAGCKESVAFYADVVDKLSEVKMYVHVVASGNISSSDFTRLIKSGCSGVAVSSEIIDSTDPVATTRSLVSELEKARRVVETEMEGLQ